MRQPLTEKDIKELKYQSRMGYLLPGLFFIISTIFIIGGMLTQKIELNSSLLVILIAAIIIISFSISYLINRKYFMDIRTGEKEGELKTIQLKEKINDFEAGSGKLYIGQEMKGFTRYNIVVENTRFQIDEEFYNNCNAGDEVVFYFASQSRYLIEIVLKNYPSIGYSSFYD